MKRFYWLMLVAGFSVTALSMPARAEQQTGDPQAQQLLEKHREYVGWQLGDGTFKTMRVTGAVTNPKGEKVEDVRFIAAGIAFRETRTMVQQGNLSYNRGFTGNIFWASYENGFTMPIYGEASKAAASYAMLMEEGTSGLPGTFKGNKFVDGKNVGLVRVTMTYGDPIDLYIDPTSGAYVRAVVDPDGPSEETLHILSYSDIVPGKKAIGSYRIDDGDNVHTNQKWEPNVDVSNDDLHPPAATASWTFASSQPVPIRLTNDRILVDATVNGVKGTFILDTGADSIFLDDKFADRAKVTVLPGSTDVYSVYGSTKDRPRRADTIDFGNAALHDAVVYSEDFSKFEGYRGLDEAGYAGMIGADFFAGALVKLDIYDSKMTILDPSADISATQGVPVFVDLSGGDLTVPMTLDNTTTVNAMLDTGNPGSILFGESLVSKNYRFNPQWLTLGPIRYNVGSWIPCCMGANYALLGYDFLKHFDFVFDYPHGRMFLTPNKN